MKKYILNVLAFAAFACGGMMTTSCSDPDDIQDLVLDRVLSPTSISARVSQSLNIIVEWDEMTGATAYEIEAYADSPDYDQRTPDLTATTTATTYTFENLIGETTYYIRVRAVDGSNPSRDSKWSTIDRTTGAEQNMNKVKSTDIESTSVKVTWTPGIQAESIVVSPTSSTSSAATVTYVLTAADIASGSATITGLTPETNYKALLKLGEKTRGTALFKTNIDFSDAKVVSPSEDWVSEIQNAVAGTKIALAPGTYELTDAKLKINNDIIIGAQSSSDLPVLNTCITVYGGASLFLYHVVLDGTNTDGSQTIDYKEEGTFGDLTVDGCEIRNYKKGVLYLNVAAALNTVTFTNNTIHDVICDGGDFFDSRKGFYAKFNFTNNTVYECAAKRDVFRMDDASSTHGGAPEYYVDSNTFHNVGNGGANYRFFYIRYAGNIITFTNNIVSGFNNKRGFANTAATDANPTMKNNYYFNTQNLLSKADGNGETPLWFDVDGTELEDNPFVDADNADFTLNSELLQSYGAGAPIWY